MLLESLVDMSVNSLYRSSFVDQAQGGRGLQANMQRYPDVVTMNAMDKAQKADQMTNQPVNNPAMGTNIGNCQGPITKIFYTKDTPA